MIVWPVPLRHIGGLRPASMRPKISCKRVSKRAEELPYMPLSTILGCYPSSLSNVGSQLRKTLSR